MIFEEGYLYHIYNQGNNKRTIFMDDQHYKYFLKLLKTHLQPHASILAYCLMPNHFHLMIRLDSMTTRFDRRRDLKNVKRNINISIAVLLSTYCKWFNHKNKTTGSLFRKNTKAKAINSLAFNNEYLHRDIASIYNLVDIVQYPQVCFDYIHRNPVKAGLVRKTHQWPYSSAAYYFKSRKDYLINHKKASKYLDIFNSDSLQPQAIV